MGENEMPIGTGHASVFEDALVVDADVHTSYRQPVIRREMATHMTHPYTSQMDPDSDYESAYPNDGWPRTMGGRLPQHIISVTDPETDIRKPLMDDFGVDHPIVNNFIALDLLPQSERIDQEMRAANNVMIERFLDGNDDFFGLCTLATREPDKTAEEIDRMGSEKGIVGAFITSAGQEKPLGHPRHDVIYQALEDNDMSVTYHGATGAIGFFDAPVLQRGFTEFIGMHALGQIWCQMLTLTSLVVEQVPVKFPDLNFIFLEAGIGWVPYMMARLNREYAERRAEVPLLEKRPEEYIRESFYFGTQPLGEFTDPTHMHQLVDVLGADSILFASDHPHYDFDHPNVMESVLRNMSEEDKAKVLHGNAIDAYGLNV